MSVENILNMYELASPADVSEGRAWYAYARLVCEDIAQTWGHSLEKVVYALAALSPRMKWERNVAALVKVLGGRYGGLMGASVEKALHILEGDLDRLSGDKVTRFAANILGDTQQVCVDTWALRIWLGDLGAPARSIKPDEYLAIQADYQEAARQVGLHPRDLQAITWVTARRLANGRAAWGQLSLDI